MNRLPESSPLAFKGIALFTPGGDVVYCIDPKKQNRWHVQLCGLLQYLLNLPELPHFLVPSYAATLDRTNRWELSVAGGAIYLGAAGKSFEGAVRRIPIRA